MKMRTGATLVLAATLAGALAGYAMPTPTADNCTTQVFEDLSYRVTCGTPAILEEVEPPPIGFWEQLQLLREIEGAEYA